MSYLALILCLLLEAVNDFNYLGLMVNYNGKFGNIVDVQVQVFDSMISPILLYGSEVWDYDVMLSCLIFHLSFIRLNAKLKNVYSNHYGDGRVRNQSY
mgnify:CR=1 FL=1